MSMAGGWDATFGHPMLICQRLSRRSRAFALQQIFPSASSAGAGVASARQLPATVRMVITLGSPFAAPRASNVASIWRLLTGGNDTAPTAEGIKLLARPIPVPATSIYTRSDGAIAWQACLEETGPRRENIEVRTTHIGRGFIQPLSGPLPTGFPSRLVGGIRSDQAPLWQVSSPHRVQPKSDQPVPEHCTIIWQASRLDCMVDMLMNIEFALLR